MKRRRNEAHQTTLICLLVLIQVAVTVRFTQAGDWPQILGPHRNGQAHGEKLLQSWPSVGPREQWSHRVGQGFAGPAVVGKHVVVFHRVGDVERVEALDTTTGRQQWKADFPATYRPGYNSDTGPRCVPLIHRDRVYVYGAAGDLYCVNLSDGKKIWSRAAYDDYKGDEGFFGVGSTPIVFDNKLMVIVGGKDGAGIVAFSLQNGKTIWKSTDENATYTSPTTATIGGKPHVVFLTRDNAVSLDGENGNVLFRVPFGKRGLTVTGATPLVFDDHLFLTASYRIGAKLVRLGGAEPATVWSNDDVLSSQYTTPVYHDGYLYGIHGREDQGVAKLRCIEAKTGKEQWTVDDFGVAHVILAGDKLLVLQVDGKLVLAKASPRRFEQITSAEIFSGSARSLPALSDGRLYVRSNATRGSGVLKSFAVGQTQPK